jgi:hypothetical protein
MAAFLVPTTAGALMARTLLHNARIVHSPLIGLATAADSPLIGLATAADSPLIGLATAADSPLIGLATAADSWQLWTQLAGACVRCCCCSCTPNAL